MQNKKSFKKGIPAVIGMAFLAAIAVYVFMLYTEKKTLAKENEVAVLVSTTEIKKGFITTNENKKTSIGIKAIPESMVPEHAFLAEDDMEASVAILNIPAGSILTRDMFENMNNITNEMRSPVLVGLKVDDLYQSAGGSIRSGNRVYIFLQDENDKTRLRWSEVYVADAFDSGGNKLFESDEGKAVRFNIYLEKSDVEEFYDGLDSKKLRIALALDL